MQQQKTQPNKMQQQKNIITINPTIKIARTINTTIKQKCNNNKPNNKNATTTNTTIKKCNNNYHKKTNTINKNITIKQQMQLQ